VPREEGVQSPFIDVRDAGDSVVITADMPGVEKDDVNISVRDGILEISTESREEVSEEKEDEPRALLHKLPSQDSPARNR
jgi:HSP20 family molecular chaperone IbpA